MYISSPKRSCAVRMATCVIAMAGVTHLAIAGVGNGTFHHGSGNITFNAATQTFTITPSDGAIIHFTNFDIAAGQTVNFLQPGSDARVLNRVFSNDPTLINGALNANGIVYLTNPAGVIFGNGAVIDAGQFYAAAGSITNSDFLNGNDLFTNLNANVVNMGTIRAMEAVHLIGRRIINDGAIDVSGINGIITLSASDDAIHIGGPDSKYMVTISTSNNFLGGIGIDNAGSLETGDGGRIRLGAGDIFAMAIQVSGAGMDATHVNFDSPTYIDDSATIHGETVFASTVDSARRGDPATLKVVGDTTFNGGVGTVRPLDSLEIVGDTAMNAGLVFTNAHQDFDGKVILLSDTKLVSNFAGDISISGKVDGQHALLIDTNGTIYLLDAIGSDDALESLTLVGNGKAVLGGKIIKTENNQNYLVKVELGHHMDMFSSAGKVMLTKAVDGSSFNLTIDAPESHIQGEMSDVRQLTTRGSGATFIGADVSVLKGMRFENAVTLTDSITLSNAGTGEIAFLSTIDGEHALLVTSAKGNVRFGGNVGQSAPLASLETIVGGTVFFGADLVQAVGDLLLNDKVNLIAVPAIATMGAEGNITFISANGSFVMGHKQKLTALGDIVINALNGSATLGDLHAFGDMFVNANAILLLARDAANVMLPDGTMVMDHGLDFVATGSFNFSVAPIVIGNGPAPKFVSNIANADAIGTLGGFDVIVAAKQLTEENYRILPESYLDPFVMAPSDPGRPDNGDPGNGGPQPPNGQPVDDDTNLATALAAAADDLEDPQLEDSINIDPADRTGLAIMGVNVREVTREALLGFVDGRAIYDDLQPPSINGSSQQPIVTINRIHRGQLHRALRHFDQTLLVIAHDPETGRIVDVRDRDNEIRSSLSRSWSKFSRMNAAGSSAEFARYVREHDAELARVFAALHELPDELMTMGLSTDEANRAFLAVLSRLASAADGLPAADLAQVIRRSPWQPI